MSEYRLDPLNITTNNNNNNRDMTSEENVGGCVEGQWEKLLGNGVVTTASILLAQHPASRMETQRRRSSGCAVSPLHKGLRPTLATNGEGEKHIFRRYRQSRINARRLRRRVVLKHGDCNVVQGHIAKRRRKYLQDIFTTLVDAQWRWTLLVFSLNFLLSWLGFAIVWWIIAYSHGDFDSGHLEGNETWTPCVNSLQGFASCFLFSLETQHTIGYGGRSITEECPEAIFTMCIQSIAGVMIQAFMVGIVFAKLSRPKKRTQTLLFSRNAIMCHRDGIPCLMFRVGDMRKSHIIEAHVRAQLIKHRVTQEGEQLPFYQTELKIGIDGAEDRIFFIWPTTIVHKIDSDSPLYHLSASDLIQERFEIVVILEGVIESTGMTTQARSSYLPSEILWGHRFQPLIAFKKETGEYEVDYSLFNNTVEVITPLCSAEELDQQRAIYKNETDNPYQSPRSHTSSCYTLDSYSMDMPSDAKVPSNPVLVSATSPCENVSISIIERTKPINNCLETYIA